MNIRESKVTGSPQFSMARVMLVLVLCCYLVSFVLPTIHTTGNISFEQRCLLGWEVFCQVILSLPFSALYLPAWFANCFLCSGVLALIEGRWRSAEISAWLCVVLALSALLPALGDADWLTILVGYYVWLLSMVMFLVGSEVVGISARRRSNRGFEGAHGIEPMSVDASHDHLPIEPAAGSFAQRIALGLWFLQLFATAFAVLSAMDEVTMIAVTGIPLAIIGLVLALVTRPIHSRPVSLFGLSAPLLVACCVLLLVSVGQGLIGAVLTKALLIVYALIALPAAAIARRHIFCWSRSEEPIGWQFSLKSLLIGATVLAVVLACIGTAVNTDATVVLLSAVATLAVTAGAAYFILR